MLSIADRQRERQLARQERQRAVQRDAVNEEPVPSFPPINKVRLENDPTSRMIANALGEFDVVKSSILKGEAGLIGVDKMPGTPAPSRFQDEDIDTALPRVVPTPEKAPSELFATPQKRPPPRYPVVSSQKSSIQQQVPVRPTPAKPLPTSRQFHPLPNAHPVWGLQAETPSRELDEIFRDMSAPSPIASLAPTPARSEPTLYLQEAHRNVLEHEPVVSDIDVDIDLNPRRALGLPIRPLSPVRSIRIPSPVRPRHESPDPRRSLGLNILPVRPLSPIRSVRQPSPIREPMRHGIVPYQESLPRGSTNTSAQPMEISSEDDESGDSSSESEEDLPEKRAPESPKNVSETSPAHTPSWNLGSFIKTTPLNHSINGDMSDNGPPSEPGPLDQREGPRSAASIALSHSDEGQPLTPAGLPLGDHLEPSSQIMAQPTDGEMIDISQVVNQFKARKAVSPLGDTDSDGSETKKPFANLLRAVGDKNSEKKTIPKLNLDSGSDLESRSRTLTQNSAPVATLTLQNNEKTMKTEVIRPLNTNEPKMDQNKSKSICQVFRQKGKQTPKQELIPTSGKENQQVAKCTEEWHQQSVLTSGKENVPTQVPVIKCSLKLFLIRRLPTSYTSTVDKVIDQVARNSERTLLDKKTPDSNACAKKRTRDLSADTVSSDSEGESPIHRKEEKRKRVDVKDVVSEKKSPNLPSQPITHPSPSVQNVHETNHERTEKGAPSPYVDADQPPGRLEPGFPQSGATVESGYESLPGVGYDQEEYRDWQHPSRVYSSYYETMKMEAEAEPDERDQTDYLSEAKRLKHLADRESDKVLQFILYMEAAMFFILTGVSMDSDGTPPNKGTQNMYKETNNLIKHISQKFRHQDCSTPQGKVLSRLMVLSMKAQAILQLKLYKSKRSEIKEHTRMLNEYFAKEIVPLPAAEVPRGGANLISPTPSPSGSVNSVGSQSSGGFHPGSRNNDSGRLLDEPGHSSLMVIPVPVPTHSTLMRNHHNVGLLQASLDLWDQADQMVFRTRSEDFFIQLDHEFGSLTLHSTLRELVRIVRAAVERLGNYNRDCAIGRDVNWP